MFPNVKLCEALFHDIIVLKIGDFLNFDFLCLWMFNFELLNCLVFGFALKFLYFSQISFGNFSVNALWVKTHSCTILLFSRFKSFNSFKFSLTDSNLRFPTMVLIAKFCAHCSFLLSFFAASSPNYITVVENWAYEGFVKGYFEF